MRYESFQFETSFGVSAQMTPSDLPEIAFAGRSNVGKSSMLNRVLGRKNLARVSSVPGKTTTINFFKGDAVRLVGEVFGTYWIAGTQKCRRARRNAGLS